MTIKQMLAKPKLLILPMMAVLLLWSFSGRFVHEWLYWLVTNLLFAATFGVICWHLVLSAGGIARDVATIGKPSHPRLFGIPKWKVYLGSAALFAIIFTFSFDIATRKMVIYQEALKDVRSSAAATLALGDDLHAGWIANSSMEIQGNSGHADIDVSIIGSRAKGRLYIKGVEADGHWRIVDLYIIKDGTGTQIDIAH